MTHMSLGALGISEAAADIREGRISSVELVADCLKRIDEVDADVQAWAFLDRDHALRQARGARRRIARQGKALGPLHGVPVGIKDIFDTGDMPTEFGSPLWAGRTPRSDAAAVARLRAAGAVIMGKTVTTEYAYFHPGKTRNPHDQERTPGGSSSGSAAAVAAFMVPGAIGSQTNGSVIRPAAFCGVVGFKPTPWAHPAHRRAAAVAHARPCRRVRALGRGRGAAGRDAWPASTRTIADTQAAGASAVRRRRRERAAAAAALCLRASPAWKYAEPVTREAFAELVETLGEQVQEVELGESFERAIDLHKTVMEVEMAHNLRRDYEKGGDQLSPVLRELIERGREQDGGRLHRAPWPRSPRSMPALDDVFNEYDAILTPAAPGEAPRGLECDRQSDLLHALDLSRHAGDHAAAAAVGSRPAAGRAAGRPARRRRAPLAHGAFPGQDYRKRKARRSEECRGRRGYSPERKEEESVMIFITGLIGIIGLGLFLGIMLWWVQALPLIIIVVGVLLLLLYDWVQTLRFGESGAGRR